MATPANKTLAIKAKDTMVNGWKDAVVEMFESL